ncbi:mitochondrial import receptor subunit TOM20 homolog [Hypanus sabinus]|uniref:mitochondrial import receptor subunit TOM20 homolog n=1 Tax=Hypanus sabinus TaxID=79690 RepID=UPI0028C37881|nr:mitochondrial import receptor subunit TOM20 homolog [Hypanus sabinus]
MRRIGAIAAGICGLLFLAYCIYFDRKLRNVPSFKERLQQRKRKQEEATVDNRVSNLPNQKDTEAMQAFFLDEIQLGEEALSQGDYDVAVNHLSNTTANCGQPQQLLQVLQLTIPPPIFQMLLVKLATAI